MGFKLFSNNGKISYGIKNYIADTKDDLKNIPKNAGAIVFVIDESKYYIMNNQFNWIEQQIENENTPQPIEIITPTGIKQISITQNGTTTHDVTEYSAAEITVNTLPEKGLVFEDYDSDGYPHSARLVGNFSSIPSCMFNQTFKKLRPTWSNYEPSYGRYITHFTIPYGVEIIYDRAFGECSAVEEFVIPPTVNKILESAFTTCWGMLSCSIPGDISFPARWPFRNCFSCKSFIFGGNVDNISSGCFSGCSAVTLYDFSHCTAIPPLASTDALGHASGCVIRIPAALSDTTLGTGNGWESATNWSALTQIIWEVI